MADYAESRIHAAAADRVARSPKVPRAILEKADKIWRKENPNLHYGGSYRAMTPSVYFDQQLGLTISTAISSHIIRAYNKNKSKAPIQCLIDVECNCERSETDCQETCLGSTPTSPQTNR